MKKILMIALLAIPMSMMAQKFGHINSQELLMMMPERTEIETAVETFAKEYEGELLKLREEYFAKIQEFQEKQATMPEGIKQARQSEIMEMEQRIQTFQNTAQTDIQKKQETLLNPVIEKVRKAINEVGAEQGFTYIFDMATQSILYTGTAATDVLPLVKTKLGLK